METFAKKTFLALKNPYGTVTACYPKVINEVRASLSENGYAYYAGYKNTDGIPGALIERFCGYGFLKHTRDKMSPGGRAVDMQLVNPLTGKWMTGSSSGTALNVFYGINDIGVGTDGGGSVLAPAAALNLYGFISPLIEQEHLKKFRKESTDGISFSPSIGFITRDFETLRTVLQKEPGVNVAAQQSDSVETAAMALFTVPDTLDIYGPRRALIDYLEKTMTSGVILKSEEGPVDVNGLGDTVFGHMGEDAALCQRQAKKGLMRVANMCGLSAVTIPQKDVGKCILLLCSSNPKDISRMLAVAETCKVERSALLEHYFGNLDMYFDS